MRGTGVGVGLYGLRRDTFFGERMCPAGGRHADLSTNFLCEETGIYTGEK